MFKKYGLFVFPSGPALANINKNKKYLDSLINADFVFFDSSYFVFLLRFLKGIEVSKLSGYLFFKKLVNFLKKNKKYKILSIDPNKKLSINNKHFFHRLGLNKNNIVNYIAPNYSNSKIEDKELLKLIIKFNPNFIIINIGGGTQEILGFYLKKKIKNKVRIYCTGAAISFFTGDQAPINVFFDKFFLGWLIRIIFNPKIFLIRYLKAFKLIFLVMEEKIKVQ